MEKKREIPIYRENRYFRPPFPVRASQKVREAGFSEPTAAASHVSLVCLRKTTPSVKDGIPTPERGNELGPERRNERLAALPDFNPRRKNAVFDALRRAPTTSHQSVLASTNLPISRRQLVPTVSVGMPSLTLCVGLPRPLTSRFSHQPTCRSLRATRSHGLRGNAVFDALRRAPTTSHQSVLASTNLPISRRKLVPTVSVGMPSLTLCVGPPRPLTSRFSH